MFLASTVKSISGRMAEKTTSSMASGWKISAMSGVRFMTSLTAWARISMSSRAAAATPGRWTLTATSFPLRSRPRYTWAMEAAPMAVSVSSPRNRFRHDVPRLATSTGSNSEKGRLFTSSWRS